MLREMLQLPPLLDESLQSQAMLLLIFAKLSPKYSDGIQPVATSNRAMIYFGAIYPKFFLFVNTYDKVNFCSALIIREFLGWVMAGWLFFLGHLAFYHFHIPLLKLVFQFSCYHTYVSYPILCIFIFSYKHGILGFPLGIKMEEGWICAKSASCLN